MLFYFDKRLYGINPSFILILVFNNSRGDISWEGGGTLNQNSYKPSQDLAEASLQKRTIAV